MVYNCRKLITRHSSERRVCKYNEIVPGYTITCCCFTQKHVIRSQLKIREVGHIYLGKGLYNSSKNNVRARFFGEQIMVSTSAVDRHLSSSKRYCVVHIISANCDQTRAKSVSEIAKDYLYLIRTIFAWVKTALNAVVV